MFVYRIERKQYFDSALSGIGSALSRGSRWNSFGTRMVYTAESLVLATLEITVHLDLSEDLPLDRFYVKIEIPENVLIQEITIDSLSENWNNKPPNILTKQFGNYFVL